MVNGLAENFNDVVVRQSAVTWPDRIPGEYQPIDITVVPEGGAPARTNDARYDGRAPLGESAQGLKALSTATTEVSPGGNPCS